MRKWLVGITALAVALGGSAGALAGPAGEGHRIVLAAPVAQRAGLAVRHSLGNGRVSVHVTDRQLAQLRRLGIPFETAAVRTVQAEDLPPQANPPLARPTPASQVPYGVKMTWGNPQLTAAALTGGEGIKVAVLDTGSIAHADFTRADGSKVIIDCVDFSSKKAEIIEGTCADGHGHGTHVTGTIAAAGGVDKQGIYGVAPGAAVMSYKVLTNQGRGYSDDIARAIRWAADRGANIITMSLGSSAPSIDELEAIRYASEKGALVISAAGNTGPEQGTILYPGGFAEVVAVAALNPDEAVSYFSGRGVTDGDNGRIADREVEVAAPGRSILSTYRDGSYRSMSGTSMAAPHIAGLAAKMWQGSGAATRAWLVSQANAHDITVGELNNNAGPGYDIAAGYGLPQVQPSSQVSWNN